MSGVNLRTGRFNLTGEERFVIEVAVGTELDKVSSSLGYVRAAGESDWDLRQRIKRQAPSPPASAQPVNPLTAQCSMGHTAPWGEECLHPDHPITGLSNEAFALRMRKLREG